MIYSGIEDSEFKDKEIQEIKTILEKLHGREFSWEEAVKAKRSLKTLAGVFYNVVSQEIKRKELLKDHPKGYHLDEGGTCIICGHHAEGENTWYDEYGLKCMLCQNALNEKILPISIAKDQNKESWYSALDLQNYFNLKGADLRECIKSSFLKVRTIPGEGKRIHLQVFLIKDNKDVLPPKKLLKSRTVKVMSKEKEYYALEPWYDYFTEKELKRLSKYRILECLPYTFAKPIDRGRLLVPVDGINPLFSFKELTKINSQQNRT